MILPYLVSLLRLIPILTNTIGFFAEMEGDLPQLNTYRFYTDRTCMFGAAVMFVLLGVLLTASGLYWKKNQSRHLIKNRFSDENLEAQRLGTGSRQI